MGDGSLDGWRALGVLALARLWPCPRCKAPAGEPCRRPGGEEYVHSEARTARWVRDAGYSVHASTLGPCHHIPRQGCPARALFNRPAGDACRALRERLEVLGLLDEEPGEWLERNREGKGALDDDAAAESSGNERKRWQIVTP
jgi:hypothetical protein